MLIVGWGLEVSGTVFVVLPAQTRFRQAQRRRRGVATVGTYGSIPRDRFNRRSAALAGRRGIRRRRGTTELRLRSAIGHCVCIGRYRGDVDVDQRAGRGTPSAFLRMKCLSSHSPTSQ